MIVRNTQLLDKCVTLGLDLPSDRKMLALNASLPTHQHPLTYLQSLCECSEFKDLLYSDTHTYLSSRYLFLTIILRFNLSHAPTISICILRTYESIFLLEYFPHSTDNSPIPYPIRYWYMYAFLNLLNIEFSFIGKNRKRRKSNLLP